MNFLFKALLSITLVLQIAEPAFAFSAAGFLPAQSRPIWHRQVEYVLEHGCEAIAVALYEGKVFYKCPSGEELWGEVLVSSDKLPLALLTKSAKEREDQRRQDDLSDYPPS